MIHQHQQYQVGAPIYGISGYFCLHFTSLLSTGCAYIRDIRLLLFTFHAIAVNWVRLYTGCQGIFVYISRHCCQLGAPIYGISGYFCLHFTPLLSTGCAYIRDIRVLLFTFHAIAVNWVRLYTG